MIQNLFHISNPEKSSYFIAIILEDQQCIGEMEFFYRLSIACQNLGWNCKLFYHKDPLLHVAKPDLIISLLDRTRYHKGCPNYLWLSHGIIRYFDENNTFCRKSFKHLAKYDGFLVAFEEIDILQRYIETKRKSFWNWKSKKFYGMPWYPTCPNTQYIPRDASRLFYCGDTWDKTRSSEKYRYFFQKLDQTGYFDVYGSLKKWDYLPNSAKGPIPFDGNSLLRTLQKSGIALILHSAEHIQGNAPTARIFEAAAAGCIIISDKHPFIIKNFGDSVLYIDQQQNGETMFEQVHQYMEWILQNPKPTQNLACKAHEIFVSNFTLEQQLMQLTRIHEKVIK